MRLELYKTKLYTQSEIKEKPLLNNLSRGFDSTFLFQFFFQFIYLQTQLFTLRLFICFP
jgi:hypothetical protein